MSNEYHVPVLVKETLHYLQPSREGLYVDGTLGGGGHAEAILMNSSANSRVLAFDADEEAIAYAQQKMHRFADRIRYVHDNVRNIRARFLELNVRKMQGLLLDLGVSSHQINTNERGFSFQMESRLDMRMDRHQKIDGWTVVNRYDQGRLALLLRNYGEEKNARKIARKIAEARKSKPIDSTTQLATVVESVVGGRFLKKSLARVFQAIRIEVNGEMDSLKKVLEDSIGLLEQGGRIVVISYHSLEDRIVKQFFREASRVTIPSPTKLLPDKQVKPTLRILTKKPVTPDSSEVINNPRAESAKLRAAERL